MWTRRDFLAASAGSLAALASAASEVDGRAAGDVARDESYWRTVQRAFDVDRALVNLNSGNSSSSPRVVQDALTHYLDASNRLPVHYRALIEQHFEGVRRQVADQFGCDAEEIALTRNATESLEIAQAGLDLDDGDEVVTTDQDYTLMLFAWQQRALRDRLKIVRIQFPVPATDDDLLQRFERAITPRTRVLHFCHVTNTTGQLFPVRALSRLARERGILTIVDGAQSAAHFPFSLRDLECDVYGASLHKWLAAPVGTGFLYVRRDVVPRIWPLHAASDDRRGDIRKFEEAGTQPAAARAAIADALHFHRLVGAERKAARLRYLTIRWIEALRHEPRVTVLTDTAPDRLWGLATLGFERGVDVPALSRHLFDAHRIIVSPVVTQRLPGPVFPYQGLRVTPNIYTTIGEIDAFVAAINDALATRLPARRAAASAEIRQNS